MDQIAHVVEVPPELARVRVPKLCIQPLVENSLRHGIGVPPPWRIRIRAERCDGHWRVGVHDSGGGFDAATLAAIRGRMQELERAPSLPEFHVQGMGLVSIFLRLKLLHGEGAFLHVGNNPEGGAAVVLGAPLPAGEVAGP